MICIDKKVYHNNNDICELKNDQLTKDYCMLLTIQEYIQLLEQNHCASYTMISYFSTTTSKRERKFYHLFDLTL